MRMDKNKSVDLLVKNTEYSEWLADVGQRFRNCQIKAASSVNTEMLMFYWQLGKDIHSMSIGRLYGNRFYKKLSSDLTSILPEIKSFSERNLRYMCKFYELYPSAILPQAMAENEASENLPQVVAKTQKMVFAIPWGHHRLIIDKCGNELDKALFYVNETLKNNWSRAILMNFIDSNLYLRQGNAVTNFQMALPVPDGDLAQAITRDPYNFDFLTLTANYNEKELKDALMNNITRFLLELGNGFAFVGREVCLKIGNTENFVDMLFYNLKLHCYVVIEVKVEEFDSRDMGQLGTYMVAVNHQIKTEKDGQTLGLIICKSKDNVKARYALEASSQPMGISEYDIKTFLPDDYQSSLPSIEEIEAELTNGVGIC